MWQVIKQPGGQLGVFSTNGNEWIARDLTPEEVEDVFAGEAGAELARKLRRVRELITLVQAGEIEKAYPVSGMTHDEAEIAAAYVPDEDEDTAP